MSGDYSRVALRPGDVSPLGTDSSSVYQGTVRTKMSTDSHTPLNVKVQDPLSYPPPPSGLPASSSTSMSSSSRRYDAERAGAGMPGMPQPDVSGGLGPHARNASWDLLSGFKKFEHDAEDFDPRNAREAHLVFAQGDIPENKFTRFYHYLLNVSIITRWLLFIVPVLGIIWIPGILGLTAFPHATIWSVKLIWWTIWLSGWWGGWWASLAIARMLPSIARITIGVVAVGSRRYIDWLSALNRYVALFIWTIGSWISYNALVNSRQQSNASAHSKQAVDIGAKLLFAFVLCSGILAGEKVAIQWIAGKFHERSYAERIADQKFAVKVLTILYQNSRDIPGRTDTMKDGTAAAKRVTVNPKQLLKQFRHGLRFAATTTTTALGNVASEIAGSSVLQPNSPQAMVQTALESANKSRLLARRLFYSFKQDNHDYLLVDDIARVFPTIDQAEMAFGLFDRDNNGDVTRDEMEVACADCHREQLSIEHSMRDVDSAVGRLDNILMTLYVVVAAIIIAVVLDTSLTSLVTGAGTLTLSMSWLIGSSLSEVLTSIIFLFVKHPFDVGDRVDIEDDTGYTVKEIRLLSTVFLNSQGCLVQAPNMVLNEKFLHNIRRSPQMSEPFTFDVAYETTFEQIEELRARMIRFLQTERRDYLPIFDVAVVDIPEQTKMSLKVDIRYKSNWQQGALKAKRRNKWVCTLKQKLAEIPIYGPGGNPHVEEGVKKYTMVPFEKVQQDEQHASSGAGKAKQERMPTGGWRLSDSHITTEDGENVFGDADEMNMLTPQRGLSSGNVSQASTLSMPTAATMPVPMAAPSPTSPRGGRSPVAGSGGMDVIEMRTPTRTRFGTGALHLV